MEMERTMGKGLKLAEKYYRAYGCRAKELKREGKKITGHLSALGPLEIITAAGFIPVRMKGSVDEPTTKADTHHRIDAFIELLEAAKSKG